jgi:hypothetical protein
MDGILLWVSQNQGLNSLSDNDRCYSNNEIKTEFRVGVGGGLKRCRWERWQKESEGLSCAVFVRISIPSMGNWWRPPVGKPQKLEQHKMHVLKRKAWQRGEMRSERQGRAELVSVQTWVSTLWRISFHRGVAQPDLGVFFSPIFVMRKFKHKKIKRILQWWAPLPLPPPLYSSAQAGLKLFIFLPQPLKCWDYRCASPYPTFAVTFKRRLLCFAMLLIGQRYKGLRKEAG